MPGAAPLGVPRYSKVGKGAERAVPTRAACVFKSQAWARFALPTLRLLCPPYARPCMIGAMTALPQARMSVDEYLAWAEAQPERYELCDGTAYAMSPEGA